MSARAGIVVTGTEVLTGRVSDRNGPWLADRLHELGVELALIVIVGDRPPDIQAALRFMADQRMDVVRIHEVNLHVDFFLGHVVCKMGR